MRTETRRFYALLGPVIAGGAVGVARAVSGGGGELLTGIMVGVGVGVALVAFVPEDDGDS